MNIEELQKQLDELKAGNEALADKNRELLRELKTARAKSSGAEIDPAEFEQLKSDLEQAQTELKKSEKRFKTETEALVKQLGEKDSALQSYLIDGGLSDALAKAGVSAPFMDAAKALLRQQAQIKAEDGKYSALMGDKPLAQAISEWAQSEQGKHFVAAPKNTGGGAAGSSSNTGHKAFKEMTSDERVALYRQNPEQYEALKKSA